MPHGGDFSFVVLSDLHYREARCAQWTAAVVAHLSQLRPRPAFCVLAGDLTEDGTPGQLTAVKRAFSGLPFPVHALPGNHDCDLEGSFENYRAVYGPTLNYRFSVAGREFLVLDSTEGRKVYRARVSRESLDWLDGQLAGLPRERPLTLFTHLPFGKNWLRPVNADAVIRLFAHHRLDGVFSGHWHGLTQTRRESTLLVTGRCASRWRRNHDGSDEKGYLLCEVRSGRLSYRFVSVGRPGEEDMRLAAAMRVNVGLSAEYERGTNSAAQAGTHG